jgi:hypothetical protein
MNLGYRSLKPLKGQFGLLRGRILLFLMETYDNGPSNVCSANCTVGIRGTTRHMQLFEISPILIPERIRQPLDC